MRVTRRRPEWRVTAIARDTYALEQKSPYAQCVDYLLVGRDRAAVIDTGLASRGALRSVVTALTDRPVDVWLTHGHADHIGHAGEFGAAYLHEADRPVQAAHSDPAFLKRLLREEMGAALAAVARPVVRRVTAIPPADYRWFGDDQVFDLGGREVTVVPVPGHTPGSVCYLDQATGGLFTGDSCCDWGVLLHLEFCLPPAVYLESARRLLGLQRAGAFRFNWPGHHGFPAAADLPEQYAACAESIADGSGVVRPRRHHAVVRYRDVLITLPRTYLAQPVGRR
ncbi:MAG: MBL fold metallo-hydrolase [Propionibacteriaceae bacterium]|jgi:glyoxylase-like metal-dependent hydrolase (beta-lactamase superfamily II)|nr:MBL fold metallo-hydrolase [Propionibacteriaceae bacterium]